MICCKKSRFVKILNTANVIELTKEDAERAIAKKQQKKAKIERRKE
jgi:hypothetical protein